MCGAGCWTDHRLVVSKLNLCIQPVRRPQGKKVTKGLDVSKLKHTRYLQPIRCTGVQFRGCRWELDSLQRHHSLHSSAMDSLGQVSRKHQNWFDENNKEIQGVLEEKHQKQKACLSNTRSVSSKTAYSNICKTVQTKLRDMQYWLSKKADEIQSFADRKYMMKFLMSSRQYMVPRAQKPPYSLVQMELVFWLTKMLSWKDGLNTLMVSLMGHHLSLTKLSTD